MIFVCRSKHQATLGLLHLMRLQRFYRDGRYHHRSRRLLRLGLLEPQSFAGLLQCPLITGGLRRVNPSADLDEETLTAIADLTDGQYFRAKDTAGLQDIYRLLDELEPVDEPEAGFRPVKSLYYWPLAGALVLTVFLCVMSLLQGIKLSLPEKVGLNAN